MRIIEVVPHHEKWQEMFVEESKKLRDIFRNEIINIYHIGSTAIKDIYAKPIIDILVEVRDIEEIDNYNEKMIQLGYEVKGENGIPNRRFFCKGGDQRTHHVHIFQQGNPEITRHLAFRDYLNHHPEEAQKYSNLKRALASKYKYDIESYIKGKDSFIKEIDGKAKKWVERID